MIYFPLLMLVFVVPDRFGFCACSSQFKTVTLIFQAGQQLVDFGMSPSGKRASTLIVTNDKEMSVQVCAALLHQFILKSKHALE